jgi:hypothetical protein
MHLAAVLSLLLARRGTSQCRASLVANRVQRKSRGGHLLQDAALLTPSGLQTRESSTPKRHDHLSAMAWNTFDKGSVDLFGELFANKRFFDDPFLADVSK